MKDRKCRGAKSLEYWIASFIYFAAQTVTLRTGDGLKLKLIHFNIKRFMTRRGKPSLSYSDNGTDFIAVSFELFKLGTFLQENQNEI